MDKVVGLALCWLWQVVGKRVYNEKDPDQAILKVAVTGGFQAKRRKIPMKKAKLLFGENEPREEIKTRIPVWLYPSTLEVIDRAAETVNCKSRSEYLERAALFYAGYISGQDATAYLPPALSKVMRGIVRDTENRICRLLFKTGGGVGYGE